MQHIALSHPLLQIVGRIADRESAEVYVVGGYVRDLLLGLGDKDIDILVIGDGVGFARKVAREIGTDSVVTFQRFGTAMVPLDNGKIEFVTARSESYSTDSRKPEVARGTLKDDLSRRDFTVNTLAASLNKDRKPDEPFLKENNAVVILACEEKQAERLIMTLRPKLKDFGGMCLVSDCQWVIGPAASY